MPPRTRPAAAMFSVCKVMLRAHSRYAASAAVAAMCRTSAAVFVNRNRGFFVLWRKANMPSIAPAAPPHHASPSSTRSGMRRAPLFAAPLSAP